eukprot:TRINITY_DN41823_c0_g1_i1.p1 TRINITY_DN41823_c0_g1~~TRINITY_DN41823_c0_g1_i1.p1  ORF type:complete len:171 (-),score=29.17 TRINITY_DN41823_c0_g1_i1:196-708(-)
MFATAQVKQTPSDKLPNASVMNACPEVVDKLRQNKLYDGVQRIESRAKHWLDGDLSRRDGVTTTLMLRNIPCKINAKRLARDLHDQGFAGTYDYLHVPSRRKNCASNLGYAFINFIDVRDAARFEAVFNGYVFEWTCSKKQCYVTAAAIQGLEANLQSNPKARLVGLIWL